MPENASIVPMTTEYARHIARWRYDGAYSFYDHNEGHIEGFMDGAHFACTDPAGDVVGYFCFGADARIPTVEERVYDEGFLDVGLGLHPDLCGRGYGLSFLNSGLDYGQKAFHTNRFRLSVAAFNERAGKVYAAAGFYVEREVTNAYYKNRFLIMKCDRSPTPSETNN